MQVNFTGNTSGLVSAVGGAKNALASLASSPTGAIVAGVAAIGAAAVGVAVKSVQMASQYEQAMNMVKALTGSNTQQMAQYDAGVKKLAVDAGVAPTALASGLYNVLSASYKGAEAMNILTLATEDSKIGMTSAAVTSDALTNVLRTFSVQAGDVTRVNGEMLQTVTLGKATFEQYATTIVKSASAASQFHISMETMNAAWSTMTSSGIRAAQASTDFQQSLKVMYGNIGTVTKSLEKNGIAFDESKFNAMSYGDKVVYLNAALQKANEMHVKVTGVTLQAAQAVQTIAKHIDDYNSNLAKLSDKQAMAQKTQQAWAITQGGFAQTMSRVQAAIDVVFVTIGQQLLPVLSKLAQQMLPLIQQFGDWVIKSGALQKVAGALTTVVSALPAIIQTTISVVTNLVNWYNQWQDVIKGVAAGLAILFIPAMIKSGVEAVISGGKIAVTFVANIIKTGVEGYTAAGKLAIYIAQMVASGAQAVISAAKITASFIASMVQSGVQAALAGAKIVATFVASLITTAAQAVVTGATFIASLIPAIIAFMTQSLIAAATAIPAMLVGFGAWVVGALAAAAATIAATWPILLIIAAIALLVVGIVLLVTHWQQVTAFLQGIWTRFTSWLMASLTAIGQFFTNIWHSILNFLQVVWNAIINVAKIAALALLVVITGPIGLLVVLFMGPFNKTWQAIQAWFKNTINGAIQFGKNFISSIIGGIESMAGALLSAVGGLFSGLGSTVHNALHFAGIPGFASGVTNFNAGPSNGWAIVGENGPELVKLPGGTNVYPSGTGPSSNLSNASSSANNGGRQDIYFQVDSYTLTHIVADRQARMVRLRQGRRAA